MGEGIWGTGGEEGPAWPHRGKNGLHGHTGETCRATWERPAWPHSRDLHGHTVEACMATQARPRARNQGQTMTRDEGQGQGRTWGCGKLARGENVDDDPAGFISKCM